MHIILRTSGERTARRALQLASKQGTVHVIDCRPFGECLRQSYKLAIELGQEFLPMVDADVLLLSHTLKQGIAYLKKCRSSVFVLDGKTKDKIFMRTRRAGIHIYRTSLLKEALKYIDDKKLKPESHVRHSMSAHGHKTVVGPVVFGIHDYEQYYRDLWRKAVAQAYKLAGTIRRSGIVGKWRRLAASDTDYKVIDAAHVYGRALAKKPVIDARLDYGAEEGLRKLGLKEKGKL